MTNRRFQTRRWAIAAGLLLCLGSALPVSAAGPDPAPAPASPPAPTPPAAEPARMVRLIVDLDVPVPSRAEMGNPEVMLAYRQAVQAAQGELIASLAGHRIKNVRRYRTLPLVALEAEPDVVELLLASPLVRSLRADRDNEIRPESQ